VPHEIDRHGAVFLLLAVFGRNGLQLLDQRVAGMITGNAFSAIVDDFDFVRRVIVSSGADILGLIRRYLRETRLQQHTFAQAFDRRHYVLVGEADAGAQQILIVDGRVALDRHMPSILIVFVSHS